MYTALIHVLIYKSRSQRHSLSMIGSGRPTTAKYTELRNIPRHGKSASPVLPLFRLLFQTPDGEIWTVKI
ncbi:hypothetical protein NQ317_012004 [Molorchus minor]|uniref:Uncharacterized protein n=1 Tax=Molorchus minor TaxID=1323400 RepID=A0ABQ9K1P4_9CUCU|nr:hypothetical protein NQ317_012004 [Molorchus minor]